MIDFFFYFVLDLFSFYMLFLFFFFFFFFSSRRRHTRSLCDWSSDVCSSDLTFVADNKIQFGPRLLNSFTDEMRETGMQAGSRVLEKKIVPASDEMRSEERRVGKECRSRWWADE